MQSVAGFLVALVLMGAAAEVFLRAGGAGERNDPLGTRGVPVGPFAADADLVVRYRSWNDFYLPSAGDLAPWLTEAARGDARPTWLFVGNSFVHGPGMIVDHVRAAVADRYILTLHRTDPLPVRLAQIDLIRQRTPPPERIFIPITTVDLVGLGEQPLATLRVTEAGNLASIPRLPHGWAERAVQHSHLAASAWFRTGHARGNPDFDTHALDTHIDPTLASDLRTLFTNLRSRVGAVPITIVLIPSYQHLMRDVPAGFQHDMRAILEPLGYDVVDPLPALQRRGDRAALFLPDKHFSPVANELLVAALLAHVRR